MNVPDFSEANCKNKGTELFFPVSQEETNMVKPHIIKICANCPVFKDCLNYALHVKVDGIWAGTTAYERRAIRAKKGIKAIPVYLGEYFVSQTDEAKAARKKRARQAAERRYENV
jgi:hypothetical protein